MTEFLIYQGKAAVALAVFYMFYRLLLSKETFHRFNRIVLLGTAALSFILPLCVITIKEVVSIPQTMTSDVDMNNEIIGNVVPIVENMDQPVWPVILCGIFGAGALAVLAHTIISTIKVKALIASGEHRTLDSGETLVITENGTAPFSWMKYIVLSREDYENGYSQILTHEKAHIALRHSWDLLFVDLITALQWFNPAIWMLKADLRAIHEFEADDAVLRSGANIKEYQYLLIRKAVSKSGYSVANSFNHSTLKARITMMLNKKSSRLSAWKALYVIPLVGISLAATAETKVEYRYEDQQPEAVADTLVGKDSENRDTTEHKETESSPVKTFKEPGSDFTKKNLREARFVVDKENNSFTLHYFNKNCDAIQVQYTGIDLDKNIYMLNGAIVTQEIMMEAAKEDPESVVIVAYLKDNNRVSCAVTTSGIYMTGRIEVKREPASLTVKRRDENGDDVKVTSSDPVVIVINGERMPEGFDLNSIDPNTIVSISVDKTEEAIAEFGEEGANGVIRITVDPEKAKEEPKPAPDIHINGKKATSGEVAALPPNPKGTISADGTVWIEIDIEDENGNKPVVDATLNKAPSFQGGSNAAFQQWVLSQIRYPEGGTKEGVVTVLFTVSETGKVTDVKVARGFDAECDAEAVRAVQSSPDWEPGLSEGKPIAVQLMIPVHFRK